jgi:hypothetical protein
MLFRGQETCFVKEGQGNVLAGWHVGVAVSCSRDLFWR